MVIMNLTLDHIYGFNDFSVCFSYPPETGNSAIGNEFLPGFSNFRYRKAVILIGANASGKSCMGKALRQIVQYLKTGNGCYLLEMADGKSGVTAPAVSEFSIDFISRDNTLYRLSGRMDPLNSDARICLQSESILPDDDYETCAGRIPASKEWIEASSRAARTLIRNIDDAFRCSFHLPCPDPADSAAQTSPPAKPSLSQSSVSQKTVLETLRAVLQTLDPTLMDIDLLHGLKDSFVIRRDGKEIIIQQGKLLNNYGLSSGTIEGITAAYYLASMLISEPCFFYCDELFCHIHSEIEKRMFGMMVDRLGDCGQLIFTSHNTDLLDLNVPKHVFCFLKKEMIGDQFRTTAQFASERLDGTDHTVRDAYENDAFCILPDDSPLDAIDNIC